jgi:hypothetical protein
MNIISILLDYGASPNTRDKLGSSVLAKVAARGYPAIIRLLLRYGAHADSVDYLGRTPLFMAVMARRLDVVEILLETGDVNTRSRTCAGRTPVSVASDANSSEILQALMDWEDGVRPEKNEAAATIRLRIDEIFGNRDSPTPRCCNTCDQPLPDAEPYLVWWICKPLYLEYWLNRRLEMCLECVAGGIGCYDRLHTLEKVVCNNGEETNDGNDGQMAAESLVSLSSYPGVATYLKGRSICINLTLPYTLLHTSRHPNQCSVHPLQTFLQRRNLPCPVQ